MCGWHLMIFAITKMKAEMNSISLSFLSLTYFKIPTINIIYMERKQKVANCCGDVIFFFFIESFFNPFLNKTQQ